MASKPLSRSSPGQTRQFTIPISTSPSETPTQTKINITELALRADNLSHETWASSAILASLIHKLHITFPTPSPSVIPVIELGAGTGLVGLAAAACWGVDVVLTDLEPIVPGLEANVAVNEELLAGKVVRCGTLDWTKPEVLDLGTGGVRALEETKAQVLIAADTCYSEEHPVMLAGVILKWLNRDAGARVVLGTALRVAYLDQINELWTLLEEGGLECGQQGQEEAQEEDFDDERLVEWSVWRWKEMEKK